MKKFVYVVSLVGEYVFHDWSVQYVITDMTNLCEVRSEIERLYDIQFDEHSTSIMSDYWKFPNMSDNRDISLIVQKVECL